MTTGTNSQSSAPSSTRERNNEENPTVLAINDNTPVNFPLELNNISFDLSIFNESFSSFDLKTLLSTSALGKSVLKYYETYGKLLNTQQNRLVDIIIKHIYNYIVKRYSIFCFFHHPLHGWGYSRPIWNMMTTFNFLSYIPGIPGTFHACKKGLLTYFVL